MAANSMQEKQSQSNPVGKLRDKSIFAIFALAACSLIAMTLMATCITAFLVLKFLPSSLNIASTNDLNNLSPSGNVSVPKPESEPIIPKIDNSLCNDELLQRVHSIGVISSQPDVTLRSMSEEYYAYMGGKERTFHWIIEERSSYGCNVILLGDVNGIETVGFSWFVDLDEQKVFPDNENANEIYTVSTYGFSGLDGYPIP